MKRGLGRGVLFVSIALLLGAPKAPAATSLPVGILPAQADAYLKAEMRDRSIPGLAVAVVREGRIVAAQAYGLANLELGVPVTLDTVFPIASLDKQLTASGIMLLVQDGKVGLDDDIGRYFVDPPQSWKAIRVRHLLSHTSGLPDVVAEESDGRIFTTYPTEQLLRNVQRQNLLFLPGNGYCYSDAGIFLAQLVTERASGMPWRRFMAERLFAPAGMTSTTFMDAAPIIKNRVAGHALLESGEIVSNRRYASIDGPLFSDVGATIIDFARWAAVLDTGRVLPKELRDQMWTPAVRADDMLYWRDYGFGFGLDSYRGVRVILHSGYTGVGIVVLPEQRTVVVIFTNLDNRFGTDAHGLALGVAGMYVPEVSLLAMPTKTDPDPGRTTRIRDEFARLVKGEPDPHLFTPLLLAALPSNLGDLATRAPHLGPFESLVFLDAEERNGERLLYYRATFAKARFFLRVAFDADGKIACLQAIHT
jgi:CubicO group peptidase (beta-lactamase class C family)